MVIFFIIPGFFFFFLSKFFTKTTGSVCSCFCFFLTFTTFDLFFNVLCATFLGNQLNDPHNFVLNREIRNNLLSIAFGL